MLHGQLLANGRQWSHPGEDSRPRWPTTTVPSVIQQLYTTMYRSIRYYTLASLPMTTSIQQYSHKIIILIQQPVKLLCSYWHSHTKPRHSWSNNPPSPILDWYSNLLCYYTPLIQQYLCHDLVIQQYSNYDNRIDTTICYTMLPLLLYHNNPPTRPLYCYLWYSNSPLWSSYWYNNLLWYYTTNNTEIYLLW